MACDPRSLYTQFCGCKWETIYTDGACLNNGTRNARAGIGVYFHEDCFMNQSERLTGRQTNQRAEIQAAVLALKVAKRHGFKKVIIKTDSHYVKKGMEEWIHNWFSNGFQDAKGRPVENEKDWRDLKNAEKGLKVRYLYVEAHVDEGNKMADKLAREGAQMMDPNTLKPNPPLSPMSARAHRDFLRAVLDF